MAYLNGYMWYLLLLINFAFLLKDTYVILLKCFPSLQIYASEERNQHSGALVFLVGQILSSVPFLFLISISSSLVFYFLVGLQDHFSLLMYFVLNFFMCLLVNEGLILVIASFWQDVYRSILTLISVHVSLLVILLGFFFITKN